MSVQTTSTVACNLLPIEEQMLLFFGEKIFQSDCKWVYNTIWEGISVYHIKSRKLSLT